MLWKEWKRASRGEYWFARIPQHPKANDFGYVLEHRAIMENKVNRILNYNETVHHKNKDKKDNRLENLELISRQAHTRLHNLEKGKQMVKLKCPMCNVNFIRPRGKTTLVKSVANLNFCSRSCSGKFSHLSKDIRLSKSKGNIIKEYHQKWTGS